ncbi:MAG TPA: radical SAM family heme chaperone HemW [Steroidobacteraceae bacterium]|nr:radical SAM family heme chaperone HemW [Steroidobacteraceae bacterium]
MVRLLSPPLALYVHLPWCVRKCPYCDFNSHVHKGELPETAYVEALLTDLDADLPLAGGRRVDTVFLGGGTPSLFAAESLAALFRGIGDRLELAADAEITLEANPGTIEHGRFAGYHEAGINRISLGAQTFNARQLAALGRIHGPSDTGRAVAELTAAGIANFNLDLMYALPEQTVENAVHDIATTVALGPPHVSHYQLTLEPGTVFHERPPVLPDEDLAHEIQVTSHARLAAAGYRQYEISAWARPGSECRHNLNYWQFGDYLGIGAGAHGKLTDAVAGSISRTVKTKQPREYLERARTGRAQRTLLGVPAEERVFEFMLNALRLPAGFEGDTFEARTGVPLAAVAATLAAAVDRGLLAPSRTRWQPTPLGLRFLNDLQAMFLVPKRAWNAGGGPGHPALTGGVSDSSRA